MSSHGCSPPTADGSGEPNEQSTGEFRPSSSTTVNPGIGTPAALAAATLTTAVGVTAAGELCSAADWSAADWSAADCSAAADSPRLLRTLLLQPQDRLPGSPRPRVLRRQACSCSCRQGRPGLPSCMRWVPSRLPPQPARKNPDALTHLTDSGCGNLDNVPLANDWPSAFCLIVDFGPRVTKSRGCMYPELRRTATAGQDLSRTARKASNSQVRLAAKERLPTLQRMLRVTRNPRTPCYRRCPQF